MQQQRFYFNQLFAPILIVYILFAPQRFMHPGQSRQEE